MKHVTMTEAAWGGKGLFGFIIEGGQDGQELKLGKDLEAGDDAEAI